MSIPTIEIELMLLDWSDSARTGPKLVFAVRDRDELVPFELATLKKGKRAGQRYMAVLVPLADDDTPEQPDKPKGGALSKLAAAFCQQDEFLVWSGNENEQLAADWIRRTCGVESRAELDHSSEAAAIFHASIRIPYSEHLKNG